jgi:hypothetical protein
MNDDHIPEPRQMVPAVGARLEPGVGRLDPERDNVFGGGAERASESNSRRPANGDPYATTPTRLHTNGCHECAWGKVLGCWRCGGR